MQRRTQTAGGKLQAVGQMPLQRQAQKCFFFAHAAARQHIQHLPIRAHQNMLTVVGMGKTAAAAQRAGAAATLPPGLKQGDLRPTAQRFRRRKPRPAAADNRHTRRGAHGLNPKSQVFRAIRALRGFGIASL